MDADRVRHHFDDESTAYDAQIRRIVAQYREQGELILELLPFAADRPIHALDLGCGTGALAGLVLGAFPHASVVACDLSPGMLAQCEVRLSPFAPRVQFRLADFGNDELGSDAFDLVVSGLAIHHLGADDTQRLYRRIGAALRPGGLFVNRELVQGDTPSWTGIYEALWRRHVALQGVDDEAWFRKYLDEDRPVALARHLAWLREAGFTEVACHYRRLNFAVFSGSKAA